MGNATMCQQPIEDKYFGESISVLSSTIIATNLAME